MSQGLYFGSSYVPSQPDILWWKGNTGSGTTDTATVGPNCTLSSALIWGTTFTLGGSTSDLVFNGSSYYANSASTIAFATNTMTVEFRINQSSYSAAANQAMLTSGSAASADFDIYNDQDANTGAIVIKLWDVAGNQGIYTIARPTANVWHHIAIVLKNGGALAPLAYVDGVSVSVTLNSDARSGSSNFATRTVYYGTFAGGGSFSPASMKDVRIFSGIRSASDIAYDSVNYP